MSEPDENEMLGDQDEEDGREKDDQYDVVRLSLDVKGVVARAVVSGKTPRRFCLRVVLPDGTIGSVEEFRDMLKNGNH